MAGGGEGGGDLMRLGEDHQEIGDVGELLGAAGGELGDAADVCGLAGVLRIEEEAVVVDGVEVLLVDVEEGDVGSGFGEETAEERTHGTGTEDGDLHVGFFLTRGRGVAPTCWSQGTGRWGWGCELRHRRWGVFRFGGAGWGGFGSGLGDWSWGAPAAGADQGIDGAGLHGLGEVETLAAGAAHGSEFLELLLVFDALGDDIHAEGAGEVEDGGDDEAGLAVPDDAADEERSILRVSKGKRWR